MRRTNRQSLICFTATAVLFVSTLALGEDRVLAPLISGALLVLSADTANILGLGNGVYRMYVRTDVDQPVTTEYNELSDAMLEKLEVHCDSLQFRVLSMEDYFGAKKLRTVNGDSKWKTAESDGGHREEQLQVACAYVVAHPRVVKSR